MANHATSPGCTQTMYRDVMLIKWGSVDQVKSSIFDISTITRNTLTNLITYTWWSALT